MLPTGFGEIFNHLPVERQNEIAAKCDSQACKDAKNAVITARNNVVTACSDVKRLESEQNSYWAVAGVFWALAGAAGVAALTTPWPANLILGIIASVLATVALIFTALALDTRRRLNNVAKPVLTNAQNKFNDAVAAVMRDCDSFCYPDLTTETCL